MSQRCSAIILIASFLFCTCAQAQYVWLDEKGVKQFSDTPPPASTPSNRIIKSPSQMTKPTENQPTTSASTPTTKATKPETIAKRNEEFNKRRTEQAEKEKKAEAEQQANADKKKNCERAKAYERALDSGIRIANTDQNGERNFLTDEQREREKADVKKALTECQQ
ncbi:MAG: DUF4124 domain-containing protein [Burkholderiales bacterium]|nr:DUF4124 domain-containing protein [Burkholderiales bacterium]